MERALRPSVGVSGARGHHLLEDAVRSYLDVRRRVRDGLKHPELVRKVRKALEPVWAGDTSVTHLWSRLRYPFLLSQQERDLGHSTVLCGSPCACTAVPCAQSA